MKKKHINLIDIILILLVLAVAAGAYLITHRNDTVSTIPCSYVIEVVNVDEAHQNAVQAGDTVMDNIRHYNMGTVTDVKVVPYTMPALNQETDTVVNVPVAGKVTLLITVEVGVYTNNGRLYTETQALIRIGQEMNFYAGGLHSKGSIVNINR